MNPNCLIGKVQLVMLPTYVFLIAFIRLCVLQIPELILELLNLRHAMLA